MYQVTVYQKAQGIPPLTFKAIEASMNGGSPRWTLPEGEMEPIVNVAHVGAIVRRRIDESTGEVFPGPEVEDGVEAIRVGMALSNGAQFSFVAKSYSNREGLPIFEWFDDKFQILALDPGSIVTLSADKFTVDKADAVHEGADDE